MELVSLPAFEEGKSISLSRQEISGMFMNEMQGRFCLLEDRLANPVFAAQYAVGEETHEDTGGLIQLAN